MTAILFAILATGALLLCLRRQRCPRPTGPTCPTEQFLARAAEQWRAKK